MKSLLIITISLVASLTQLNGQVIVDSISNKLSLLNNKEVGVIRTNPETTFEEIQKEINWEAYDSTYATTPDTAIWLKFQIENQSKDTVLSYLFSKNYFNTLYQEEGRGFTKTLNGLYVPRPQRVIKTVDYILPLELLPFQKSQIYLQLRDKRLTFRFNYPSIYTEKVYFEHLQRDYQSQSNPLAFIYFYIISLITIMVFTLVFWVWFSKKLYFYYMGYLFFQIIYGFLVLRSTLAPIATFFQNDPELANDLFEPVQFVFIGFYIFFIIYLLRVKKYDKLLYKILIYLGLTCFVYAISRLVLSYFLVDPQIAGTIFSVVRLIILPINFILIFWIIYKVKHPLLIYFIIGQSFFFIGAVLASYVGYWGLQNVPGSIFNFKEAPNIIFQIGLLIEVYCFSLALGKNVFLLQKEKEKTTVKLIAQLQENKLLQEGMNLELDKKVNEKTTELIQLYSQLEVEKEEKIKSEFSQRLKETEMVALRSQMNPHFIFNSLSAIKHLIMTSRNDDAIIYLDDFSSLLRGILQNSNRKKITVEEELEILEVYLSLEKNRMGPDFNYHIEVSSREALSQFHIPPLLLQPIVENAIWHGLQPSLKAKKELTVVFDTTENLTITIEDNGIGRKESAKKEKLHRAMGTSIVQDRLTLFNHLNDYGIHLKITDIEEDGHALGTRITLTYQY